MHAMVGKGQTVHPQHRPASAPSELGREGLQEGGINARLLCRPQHGRVNRRRPLLLSFLLASLCCTGRLALGCLLLLWLLLLLPCRCCCCCRRLGLSRRCPRLSHVDVAACCRCCGGRGRRSRLLLARRCWRLCCLHCGGQCLSKEVCRDGAGTLALLLLRWSRRLLCLRCMLLRVSPRRRRRGSLLLLLLRRLVLLFCLRGCWRSLRHGRCSDRLARRSRLLLRLLRLLLLRGLLF